ncbi:hypothetical protein [Streptomyces sp. NPDC048272]|uniref:hypothetical protein n=1 Tax=Streptomyces sp. NPDC048272 TaxID=3154616 RepID=UPI0034124A51
MDAYSLGAREQYAWQVATQDQWRQCMTRFGFKSFNPPSVSTETAIAASDIDMGRRYGISDPEAAKTRGYHLPATPEPPRWEPAKGAEEAVFTGNGKEVVDGLYAGQKVPEGGCRGEAKRAFPVPQTPEAANVEGRAFAAAQQDPAVVQAFDQWSACMGKSGLDVKTPLDDLAALGVTLEGPNPSSREMEIAVSDVECKRKTGLIALWHNKEEREQRSEIANSASKLDVEREVKDGVVKKAIQAYKSKMQGSQ